MTRKMQTAIRADAMDAALKMNDFERAEAIENRKQKIVELQEEVRYHTAFLVGYEAASIQRVNEKLSAMGH